MSRVVNIMPVIIYTADDIKRIRKSTGLSQRLFAEYLGVSHKTVEAWEAGINAPAGAASRLLNMIERNKDIINEYPFVGLSDDQLIKH